MTPSSIPIATDNIHKFACLCGLALIVTATFSFVSLYTSSLDRKIRFSEAVITLESKSPRTKAEEDLLALNRRLIEVSKANETLGLIAITIVLAGGLGLSFYGGKQWRNTVQPRDNRLADLQVEKLELEVAALRTARATPPVSEGRDA